MTKYKYFIPIVGFILFIVDLFKYEDSFIEKYYGEDLGFIFILYTLTIHIPLFVLIGFCFIIT